MERRERQCIYCHIVKISVEEDGSDFVEEDDNEELTSRSVQGNAHVVTSENPVISLSVPSDHDLDTASPNSSFASVEIECGTPDHPGDESGSSCHINDKNGVSNELSTPCLARRRYVTFFTKNYCVKLFKIKKN